MAVVDGNCVDGRVVGFHLANQRASFDRPEIRKNNFTFFICNMSRLNDGKEVMECSNSQIRFEI